MKALVFPLAVSVALLALPAAAQHAGSDSRRGAAPAYHAPATQPRPPAPQPHPPATGGSHSPSASGFNLNRDIGGTRPVIQSLPAGHVNQPVVNRRVTQPVAQRPENPPARTYAPPPGRRTAFPNPRYHGQPAWGWNHGVQWTPAPVYYGGGFWGPFVLGAAAGAIFFGTFDDPYTNQAYESYQAEPDSPGAILLQNYGLTQTPCGPPDLVVIFGPDNSLICAYPNDQVGPGEYDMDPSTLSLVSR